MFYHFRIFHKKLYIAHIPVMYPNKNFYNYNNESYYDFGCYKLIKKLYYIKCI